MKDMIREYFEIMLNDGLELEGAKDNLLELVEEIAQEFESEVNDNE